VDRRVKASGFSLYLNARVIEKASRYHVVCYLTNRFPVQHRQ